MSDTTHMFPRAPSEVSQWPSVSRLALAELGDAEISMLYWHLALPILYAVVARENEQAQLSDFPEAQWRAARRY